MAYELEEIRTGQEIFYYLLENHELREDNEPLLYKAYTEQEEAQNQKKYKEEIVGRKIER